MTNCQSKSITFLMPGGVNKNPIGGYKVVYEYANKLADDGFKVTIVYTASLLFKKTAIRHKINIVLKYPYDLITKAYSGNNWFVLNKKIREIFVPSLSNCFIPKSDYYVATSIETAMYAVRYPVVRNRIIYLVQGFENWKYSDEEVIDTYRYGFVNIVISKWLKEIFEKNNVSCIYIPNGFDFKMFQLINPIIGREPLHVSMLYHKSELKGCKYGIEVLKILKRRFPELKATLFGFPERPKDLPEWINYYQKPNKILHNKIYNDSSVFIAPSLSEGWGLTVGEAMICGACVACTDAGGFKEMVTSGETGMMSKIKDVDSMVKNVDYLLRNTHEREIMAVNGNKKIMQFTWNKSYEKFKSLLNF